ncbi:hypothetical protein K491DRAFT_757893, partial [Lophiostoma macrostomum CBS 122681]
MEFRTNAGYHATLIGINAYPESPLRGCVRDVQELKKYLERMPQQVDICMFTGSTAGDSNSSLLAGDPEVWPTYDNVMSRLKHITSSANTGDFVYIHFSGHGTTIHSDPSKRLLGDLALVLLDVTDKSVIRYLRGFDLAHILKRMVEKGLVVTLVLDCCFSGSVVRNDPLVRYLEYDLGADAAYPQLSSFPSAEDYPEAYRSASMRSNWLVNPDGYTILTACGPTEIAKEIVFNDGQRQGALSYYLRRTFSKLGGVEAKQQHIYYHLCARFRETQVERKNKQTPMFYGNKSLGFFGHVNNESFSAPIPIVRRSDGSIRLEAGQAHGVCKGDRFALCPFDDGITDTLTTNNSPVLATISDVVELTSEMQIAQTLSIPIGTGWMATPLTRLSIRALPVRFEDSSTYKTDWNAILQERESLDISIGRVGVPDYTFSFYVAIDDDNYEVQDETCQPIIRIPGSPQDREGSVRHVLALLEHLAKFKLVRNLTNRALEDTTHSFRNSFNVHLKDQVGNTYGPGCLHLGYLHSGCFHPECAIAVEDDDTLELEIESRVKEDDVLHVHIYNLGYNWEIENILHANHDVIPGGTKWMKNLHMMLSFDAKGEARIHEDIIKVFITTTLTSFMSLELPELATRSAGGDKDATRGEDSGAQSEDWAALNFRIRYKK